MHANLSYFSIHHHGKRRIILTILNGIILWRQSVRDCWTLHSEENNTNIWHWLCWPLQRRQAGRLKRKWAPCNRKRKALTKIFQEEGLKIVVEGNLKQTDFLDVILLDLETGLHAPYRKPNGQPCYINTGSNHPPMVIKQLPRMIEKQLSDLSSNEETFRNVALRKCPEEQWVCRLQSDILQDLRVKD